MFEGRTEQFSIFFDWALVVLGPEMKLKMSDVAFLPPFFLKYSCFSILLKYLLVDGRTGIKPSTGASDNLISIFLGLVALSVLRSRVTSFEWTSHPVISLFLPQFKITSQFSNKTVDPAVILLYDVKKDYRLVWLTVNLFLALSSNSSGSLEATYKTTLGFCWLVLPWASASMMQSMMVGTLDDICNYLRSNIIERLEQIQVYIMLMEKQRKVIGSNLII